MPTAMALCLSARTPGCAPPRHDPEIFSRPPEPGPLLGASSAHVSTTCCHLDYYGQFPGKIFALLEGGLAIHGGVLGGILVGGGYAWRRGLPVRQYLDIARRAVPGMPSGVGTTF